MHRALLAVVLALPMAACATEPLDFRVVPASSDPRDDPYRSASALAIALEENGVLLPGTVHELPIDSAQLVVPWFPFGTDLRLRIETRGRLGDEEIVLARGRSFPFDYPAGGPPPSTPPDVTLGILGFFGRTTASGPGTTPHAAIAIDGGALIVTATGRLWRYEAHYDDGTDGPHPDGRARFFLATNATLGPDAEWVALEGRGVLGFLDDRLELWGTDAARVAQLADSLLRAHGARPAFVALDDGALLIGGDVGGVPSSALTRVRVDPSGALSIEALSPLAEGISDARAVTVRVRDQGGAVMERVLVHGGRTTTGPTTRLLLLDPGARDPVVHALVDPAVAPSGASSVALSTGLVALVGGAEATGVTDAVVLVQIRASTIESVTRLRFGLSSPRRDAAVAVIGEGVEALALIAGGTGALGAPVSDTDLLEVPLGPADVFATGALPAPAAAPVAVLLGDGSVLVVGEGLTAVYMSPREPR